MSWVFALSLLTIALFLVCVGIVAYCVLRDRSLRGMRVRNSEIHRERVTVTLPSFALRDFKDRTYE